MIEHEFEPTGYYAEDGFVPPSASDRTRAMKEAAEMGKNLAIMYFTKERNMNNDDNRQGGNEKGVPQIEVTPEVVDVVADVIMSRCADDMATVAWAKGVATAILDAASLATSRQRKGDRCENQSEH